MVMGCQIRGFEKTVIKRIRL